jgi:RND family efflux transporter MFP subunit
MAAVMTQEIRSLIPAWLSQQCRQFEGPIRAAVLLGKADSGPFHPVAQWPDDSAAVALAQAGLSAIRSRASVLQSRDDSLPAVEQAGDILACPILRADHLLGVVAVEIRSDDREKQEQLLETLQQNTASLERVIRVKPQVDESQAFTVLDLIAASIENGEYHAAARTVTTRFAAALKLDQVSLGWLDGKQSRIDVVSGSASVNPKMLLMRTMGAAMDEAIKQDATMCFPGNDDHGICVAHEKLYRLRNGGQVCTIPVNYAGELVGAFMLEYGNEEGFDTDTISVCETAVSLIGPILYDKRLQSRGIGERCVARLTGRDKTRRRPGRRLRKLATVVALVAVGYLATLTGEYRVTADAALEGMVQRMVVAPVTGYIAEVAARAGDMVHEGDLLVRLDDKDFELERLRWLSESNQLQREYREAMAEYDSAGVTILRAKLDSASAQLALAEENLARTRILAPMDGVLVTGDLDQSLGAPVERGDTLYEIAPLETYRVVLEVDERDIGRLRVGQSGQLALVGLPNRRLEFEIERITPVSSTEEGRNYFSVEARLKETIEVLRPGMAGVGKVSIGQQRLAWIWAHELIEWFQLWTWAWLP